MKCPHCLLAIHPAARTTLLETAVIPAIEAGPHQGDDYQILATLNVCPNCRGASVDFERYDFSSFLFDKTTVFPAVGKFNPAPPEVPADIADDFNEANLVLRLSPKASAALSRRCLQGVLSSHGYTSHNLVNQVEDALAEQDASKSLPSAIRENMDAIRNFGNFSAHPITDKTSLQVVAVEEGEAEWCLEILRDLFDHYYVGPSKAAARRVSLASKLAAAGKPSMKLPPKS